MFGSVLLRGRVSFDTGHILCYSTYTLPPLWATKLMSDESFVHKITTASTQENNE